MEHCPHERRRRFQWMFANIRRRFPMFERSVLCPRAPRRMCPTRTGRAGTIYILCSTPMCCVHNVFISCSHASDVLQRRVCYTLHSRRVAGAGRGPAGRILYYIVGTLNIILYYIIDTLYKRRRCWTWTSRAHFILNFIFIL